MALALITGSCGLIGSEVSLCFSRAGFQIAGVDNNQRAVFFGAEGDTAWSLDRLRSAIPGYAHYEIDIRDRAAILDLLAGLTPAVIIHTAAQPSHDRAASIPFDDFDVNAVGTLNLLEAARRSCPESPFIPMSTNADQLSEWTIAPARTKTALVNDARESTHRTGRGFPTIAGAIAFLHR